jgi:ATP-dependent DNA helicase RecG
MTSTDLNTLLARGESLHTEFKQWPIHPGDLAAAITAFANTDGGSILLGVADNGQVVGVAESDRDRAAQTVDNVAQNVQPPVTVVLETITNDQGQVVLVVQT